MNCLVVDDEEFSRNVVKIFVEKTDKLKLVGECENAIDAFNMLKKKDIDVIFLDVEMPEMTGMDLIKSMDNLPQVVLITARKDYAIEAFEYSVTDYLVKPINYPRFLKAVEKVTKNHQEGEGNDILPSNNQEDIYVKSDSKIVKINLNNILFVEALSDYVIINTPEKRYIVHSTMKGIAQKLPDHIFSRVHRSYIVNINKIESIEDTNIIMPKKNIPIGASYKAKFMKKLNFL